MKGFKRQRVPLTDKELAREFRQHQRRVLYETAIHEAGHAVVTCLIGEALDHVTIVPGRGYAGRSVPLRNPDAAVGDALWAEANAIGRQLVLIDYDSQTKRATFLERRGYKPNYKDREKSTGTPAAQEVVDHMEDLRDRARAAWDKASAVKTWGDHVRQLKHTLGGPVAECVFFDLPFAGPGSRKHTEAELQRLPQHMRKIFASGRVCTGNQEWSGDFQLIRQALKDMGIETRARKGVLEHFRQEVEAIVRQHRTAIERVAKALLKRKTLTGAEVAQIIEEVRA